MVTRAQTMARIKAAARTVSNSGQPRTLVAVATTKAIGEVPTESLVEYDGLQDMILDADIARIQVQPETFEIAVAGKTVTYTPDAKFIRQDGRIGYREFKPNWRDLDPEQKAKLKAAGEYLGAQGYEFSVVQVDDLRKSARIHNIKLLRRYANWPCSPRLRAQVLDALGDRHDLVLQDLRDLVGQPALGPLYRMLWDQQVAFDMDAAPLDSHTPVWRTPS